MSLVLVLMFDLEATGWRFMAIIGEVIVSRKSKIFNYRKSSRFTIDDGAGQRFVVNNSKSQRFLRDVKVKDSRLSWWKWFKLLATLV